MTALPSSVFIKEFMNKTNFFPGLVPNEADAAECNEIMSVIEDLAPYDANINASITRANGGRFHTVIAINAICGQFKSEAKSLSLLESLKLAQDSMLVILSRWKALRFAAEPQS